ncbi:hypothetical protein [Alicyclobacillus sp. SO9]|uniref:hypothetical protein n=1 Tax=Alicyclobacillus sp. SO9 TaxID=2665646 RepID=UPI0018E7C6E3|nr:hypothetical protein [Alicyclobacillus sp. SO9]QQE77500.1 hypothetical protein GI364_16330 [Alicyclobacillus sp. SO9]
MKEKKLRDRNKGANTQDFSKENFIEVESPDDFRYEGKQTTKNSENANKRS